MSHELEIAQILLDANAVRVRPERPFLWASGLRAPLYCDNRLLISHVIHRRRVCQAFQEVIAEHDWHLDAIAGTATAGIPHAAWLAEAQNLPMVYVRSKAKKHGRENRIEGSLSPGSRVLLIEDLVSTGGSSLAAAKALAESGMQVMAVCAIFQYGLEKANTRFSDAGIPLFSLTSLNGLMKLLQTQGVLQERELTTIKNWQTDPVAWSDDHREKP